MGSRHGDRLVVLLPTGLVDNICRSKRCSHWPQLPLQGEGAAHRGGECPQRSAGAPALGTRTFTGRASPRKHEAVLTHPRQFQCGTQPLTPTAPLSPSFRVGVRALLADSARRLPTRRQPTCQQQRTVARYASRTNTPSPSTDSLEAAPEATMANSRPSSLLPVLPPPLPPPTPPAPLRTYPPPTQPSAKPRPHPPAR